MPRTCSARRGRPRAAQARARSSDPAAGRSRACLRSRNTRRSSARRSSWDTSPWRPRPRPDRAAWGGSSRGRSTRRCRAAGRSSAGAPPPLVARRIRATRRRAAAAPRVAPRLCRAWVRWSRGARRAAAHRPDHARREAARAIRRWRSPAVPRPPGCPAARTNSGRSQSRAAPRRTPSWHPHPWRIGAPSARRRAW